MGVGQGLLRLLALCPSPISLLRRNAFIGSSYPFRTLSKQVPGAPKGGSTRTTREPPAEAGARPDRSLKKKTTFWVDFQWRPQECPGPSAIGPQGPCDLWAAPGQPGEAAAPIQLLLLTTSRSGLPHPRARGVP